MTTTSQAISDEGHMRIQHNVTGLLAASAMSMGMTVTPAPSLAAPTIVGTTYYDTSTKNCGTNDSCLLPFSAAPAGKVVRVTQASCHLEFNGVGVEVLGISPGLFTPLAFMPAQLMAVDGARRYYQANAQLMLPVLPSQTPVITARVTPNANPASLDLVVRCQISGTIQVAP